MSIISSRSDHRPMVGLPPERRGPLVAIGLSGASAVACLVAAIALASGVLQ